MASLLEEIADRLARDVIRAAEELGDENLVGEMSKLIGASSPTTQEAFTTAVRVRLAEQRARRALEERLGPRYAELFAASQPTSVAPPLREESQPARSPATPAPRAEPSPDRTSAPAPLRPEPAPVRSPTPVAATPESAAKDRAREAKPATGRPAAARPVQGLTEAPTAFAPAPVPPVAAPAAPAAPPVVAEAPAAAGSGVRPRMAATLERPTLTPADTATAPPSPESLAAALALAASLPRRTVPPAEPRPITPSAYPDIEIPDGDWG